nr:MAG TPA: hypothetical protein [Caudoviricetes sp.]
MTLEQQLELEKMYKNISESRVVPHKRERGGS